MVTRNFAAYKVFVLPTLIFARRTAFKMKEIPLTKGYIAQVDDEQFDKLIKLKWHAQVHKHTVYAASITKDEKGKRVYFLMHRVILGVTSSRVYVDHKDGNGLNNQGFNIRPCTSSQNAMNSKGNLASVPQVALQIFKAIQESEK